MLIFTWTPALIASAGGSQSLNMGLAFTSFMLALTAGMLSSAIKAFMFRNLLALWDLLSKPLC